MQTNLNTNQSFGMAMIIRPSAQKIIAKKVTKPEDIHSLETFVKLQEANPFKVDIREELGKLVTYILNVKDKNDGTLIVLEQGFFERHFQNPLKFIERCCKKADKLKEDKYLSNIDPKMKDIFKKTDESIVD